MAHSAFGEVARDPIFPLALTPPWHWNVSSCLDPAAGLRYATSKVGHQAPPAGQAEEHLLPPQLLIGGLCRTRFHMGDPNGSVRCASSCAGVDVLLAGMGPYMPETES